MHKALIVAFLVCCVPTLAQNQHSMPAMDVSGPGAEKPGPKMKDMQDMHNMPSMDEGNSQAMHSMEGQHLDIGPHMKMTTLRAAKNGNREKADQVAQAATAVAEKYHDYKVALADGYKIFLPSCHKNSITLRIIGTPSRRENILTLRIPRRCSTRNRATITSLSA